MSLRLSLMCLLLLSACATTPALSPNEGPDYRLGQQAGEPMLVSGRAITGPATAIQLLEHGARGRFRDAALELAWTETALTGTAGQRAAQLTLEEGEGKTRVWGYLGSIRVDYTLTAETLQGQVGLCVYDMRREPGGFVGQRSCSGPLEAAFAVHFPQPLMERPLGERALMMTLAFVNTTGTYSQAGALARRIPPPDRVGRPPQPGVHPASPIIIRPAPSPTRTAQPPPRQRQ